MTTTELISDAINKLHHLKGAKLQKAHELISELAADELKKNSQATEGKKKERFIGSMKGSLVYMSADFNEPLEDFKDYMPDEQPS